MSRLFGRMALAALMAGSGGAIVRAQAATQDSADAVLADCGQPGLPNSSIDACLERVRVLDETDPSPRLQSLEAQLEREAAKSEPAAPSNPAPQATAGQDSQAASSEGYSPYQGAPGPGASTGTEDDSSGMPGVPPVQDPDTGPASPDGQPNPQ